MNRSQTDSLAADEESKVLRFYRELDRMVDDMSQGIPMLGLAGLMMMEYQQ